jgi:hypothetical protein
LKTLMTQDEFVSFIVWAWGKASTYEC